jgi:hypothetical protein
MRRSIAPAPVLEAEPLLKGSAASSRERAEKRRLPASSSLSNMSDIAHQHATRNGLRLHSFLDWANPPIQFAAFA